MALLIASDLHKDIAGRPLLQSVSFTLRRGDRMTVAGRNGSGKTTLLRMLAGEESIDRGELSVSKAVRIALHDQRPPREAVEAGSALTLGDYLLSGCGRELALEAQLSRLEQEMASGAADPRVLSRYADAQARFETLGGYLWREQALTMSRGLGFVEEDFARPLRSLSGGELTRASLARALATRADVLLLDEPTNHLDIASLEWLETRLNELDAAVVLVAHDRWFLEAVGTSVLELYGGGRSTATRSRFFAGPWHAWREEQAARQIALGRAIDAQRAEIARMERFVQRFRAKATKAKQAQSRLKRLEKIERIDPQQADDRSLTFAFKPPARSGRVIFELSEARIEVGGDDGRPATVLLQEASLWLERAEHVCLVGANGSGKTTLIETLVGRLPLRAGKLSVGHNVNVGYLSQHSDQLGAGGHRDQSVLEVAQHATGLTPNKARALLARFLFSGEEAEKPLDGLSGGERQRLALAILMNGTPHPPNVLILDEPTNHLDLDAREALEDALRSFEGALLLISHDRALLDAVGSRTLVVEDGALSSYLGGWPEYVRLREALRDEASAGGVGPANGASPRARGGGPNRARDGGPNRARDGGPNRAGDGGPNRAGGGGSNRALAPEPNPRGGEQAKENAKRTAAAAKRRVAQQAKAERAVEAAEGALRALELELADPSAWATRYESAKSEARHTAARRAVEQAYAQLEAVAE